MLNRTVEQDGEQDNLTGR